MKILVTGAAGFIGFHLTKRLLYEGFDVIGLDDLNSYYDPTLKVARLDELKKIANNLKSSFLFFQEKGTKFSKFGSYYGPESVFWKLL